MFLPGNAHCLLEGRLQMKAALPFPSHPLSFLSVGEKYRSFVFDAKRLVSAVAQGFRWDSGGSSAAAAGKKEQQPTDLLLTCGILAKSRG